jgi:hypothetical protein
MSDPPEQVIYDLARAALAQQGEHVADLRARAGTLIGGAALSNSVFAALAIDSTTGLGGWEIAALVALGLVLSCGLVILLPHRLVFVLDIDELYANFWGERGDRPLVYRRLADVRWRSRRRNSRRVQLLHGAFAAGIVLLAADHAAPAHRDGARDAGHRRAQEVGRPSRVAPTAAGPREPPPDAHRPATRAIPSIPASRTTRTTRQELSAKRRAPHEARRFLGAHASARVVHPLR